MNIFTRILGIVMLMASLSFSACGGIQGNANLLLLLLGGGSNGDSIVTFISVEQNGGISGTADSTKLVLTFDVNPTTLTADNITVDGAAKGDLTGTGKTRSLAISNITVGNGETIDVTITNPTGYSITGSPREAVVYRQNLWTWVSGSDVRSQYGVYGTKGVADAANVPGARNNVVTWIDADGNLWLFGGEGYDSEGNVGRLNDLWKYDGTNWTWVSGSDVRNQSGVYGTKGEAHAANIPGGRSHSVGWIDDGGNLWLFGGSGRDSEGDIGPLNDLWKYDGLNWIWVSGSDVINQSGVYGTKGEAHAANIPGGRGYSVGWIDDGGNLWLFGGAGYDSEGDYGPLNDLWKYDGTNWTWVSGTNVRMQPGVYGDKGVAHADNVPGARIMSGSWIDAGGNLWLFGGVGYVADVSGHLNDLWMFDGTNWTWVSGSNAINQYGVYGTKGVADAVNIPGGRGCPLSWIDIGGNFWLFGGSGYDSGGDHGLLNDLWKYDGVNWIWVSGSNVRNQSGVYGTKGVAHEANISGGRSNSASWIDAEGNFWLFGGGGIDSEGVQDRLNDLWRYEFF